MFKGIRDRLTDSQKALFRLVVWSCLVIWMTAFLIFSVIYSSIARNMATTWVEGFMGEMLKWILPAGIIFISVLIVVVIAKFTKKKLGRS